MGKANKKIGQEAELNGREGRCALKGFQGRGKKVAVAQKKRNKMSLGNGARRLPTKKGGSLKAFYIFSIFKSIKLVGHGLRPDGAKKEKEEGRKGENIMGEKGKRKKRRKK